MNFCDRPLNVTLIAMTCVAVLVLLFGLMITSWHHAPVKPYMRFDNELRMTFIHFALATNSVARLEEARLIESLTAKRLHDQGALIPIREVLTLLGEPEWEDKSGCSFFYKVDSDKDFPLLQFIGLNPRYVDRCLIHEDYCHDK